jgi:drug/metabolite transporter (DMT)-like permease
VIAVLGGLGAALMWAATTLCSSRSTRMIGARSVLSWVMIVGCAIVIPWVAVTGVPAGLDGAAAAWLVVSGAGNVAGLLLTYAALRTGKVGVIAPIISTEGAIAAVIALVTGERVGVASGVMLLVIAAGIVLAGAAREPGPAREPSAPDERRAVALALAAAACFGVGLYSTGRVSLDLPVAWALLPARAIGVAVVAAPLALTSRLRLSRDALPLVVAGGLCEVAGFGLFAVGARHGIAVSAVLASQFGGIAAIAGFLLFRERLVRVQVIGVTAIVVGVAALTALQSA